VSKLTLRNVHARIVESGWCKSQSVRGNECVRLLGDMPIEKLKEQHLDKLRKKLLARGISDATLNRYLASMSRMLNFAKQRGVIERVPYIEWVKEENKRVRYMTKIEEKQMGKLLKKQKKIEYLHLFIVLLDTGMRLSEAMGLECENIERNFITLYKTKTNQSRSVPLTARALKIITPLKKNGGLVFGHLDYWGVEHCWQKLRKDMGLRKDKQFVIHCLRHTFATRLAQSGAIEIHLIGQFLGHKTLGTTMRYAHLLPKNLLPAINVLDNFNGKGN